LIRNKEDKGGLGPARKPSPGTCSDNKPTENNRSLSAYSNSTAYNNSLCPICGGNHNVLVISLENGSHIVTHPFRKEKVKKVKVADGKRRATRLDLIDTFWPKEGDI
jgi:hypothetical protein